MIPIFLLGSAVYLVRTTLHCFPCTNLIWQGLQLTHLQLSHEKYMQEANDRVEQLEAEIQTMQAKRDQRTLAIVR
jgi:hypothetical protein